MHKSYFFIKFYPKYFILPCFAHPLLLFTFSWNPVPDVVCKICSVISHFCNFRIVWSAEISPLLATVEATIWFMGEKGGLGWNCVSCIFIISTTPKPIHRNQFPLICLFLSFPMICSRIVRPTTVFSKLWSYHTSQNGNQMISIFKLKILAPIGRDLEILA